MKWTTHQKNVTKWPALRISNMHDHAYGPAKIFNAGQRDIFDGYAEDRTKLNRLNLPYLPILIGFMSC